jgi:hypothetical protein
MSGLHDALSASSKTKKTAKRNKTMSGLYRATPRLLNGEAPRLVSVEKLIGSRFAFVHASPCGK